MLKYRFADLNVAFNSRFEDMFKILFKGFEEDFEEADITFDITEPDIKFERENDKENMLNQYDHILALASSLRKIGEKLPGYDAAILHSATFSVDGRGIALAAFSGTGKSTHMFLWQKMLGDRFQIVNGDKPFVRFIDGELYVYGTPWAGKEGMKENVKVRLTDLCQIVRSETNHTEPMSKQEGVSLLLKQIYIPFDPIARVKTLQLIERIAESINFWKISCNMDIEAAEVSYKAIFGE